MSVVMEHGGLPKGVNFVNPDMGLKDLISHIQLRRSVLRFCKANAFAAYCRTVEIDKVGARA